LSQYAPTIASLGNSPRQGNSNSQSNSHTQQMHDIDQRSIRRRLITAFSFTQRTINGDSFRLAQKSRKDNQEATKGVMQT
jgi:hypothetical protein